MAAQNHDAELCDFLLKAGASTNAMGKYYGGGWYNWYVTTFTTRSLILLFLPGLLFNFSNRSPLHALVKSTVLDSKRFKNTFRLFAPEINLSNDNPQCLCPMDTMIESHCNEFRSHPGIGEKYPATVWALATASSNNMDIVHPGFWSDVIESLIIFGPLYIDELLDSILNLGPSIITGLNTSPCDTRSLCHCYVQKGGFSETVLQTFLSKGGNLHIITRDYSFRQPHTPTSLSMDNPESFDIWATFVNEFVENIEQFLEDEISAGVVVEEGWDINSLRILFNMDVTPYEQDECQLCTKSAYEEYCNEGVSSFRCPRWDKKLAGIKWAANPERLEDEIRHMNWRVKYDKLCGDCWSLSEEEVEEALEEGREPRKRIGELDSEDSSTESDAESEELSSDYDSPFLLSLG